MDVKTIYKNGLPVEAVVLYGYTDALEIVEQECGVELARYIEREMKAEDKTKDLKKDIEALEYENKAYTDDTVSYTHLNDYLESIIACLYRESDHCAWKSHLSMGKVG